MHWADVFLVLFVSHLVGDYGLQTDWQARHKRGGLTRADPQSRRALTAHVCTYTLAFVPALVWLATDTGAWLVAVVAAIAVPHFVQDDGRLLTAYVRAVKGPGGTQIASVMAAVDQTGHLLVLFGLALALGS